MSDTLRLTGSWNLDSINQVAGFFYSHHGIYINEINDRLAKAGYRPANLRDLFALWESVGTNIFEGFPRAIGMLAIYQIIGTDLQEVQEEDVIVTGIISFAGPIGCRFKYNGLICDHSGTVIMAIKIREKGMPQDPPTA